MILVEILGPMAMMWIISLLIRFSFSGEDGMKALREKAERTGEIEELEKISRWTILLTLSVTFLFSGLFLVFVIWMLASHGKQGVGMEWFRAHGAALTASILAVLLLLLTATRLTVRRELKKDDPAEQEGGREVQIRCMNNPKRFDLYMTGLMMQFFMLVFPVAMFCSPYISNGIAVFSSVVVLSITALCIYGAVSESRNLFLLAEMNRTGIRYYTTCRKGILIEWKSVERIRFFDREISLELKAGKTGEKQRTEIIDLKRSHYSAATLRYMFRSVAPNGLV